MRKFVASALITARTDSSWSAAMKSARKGLQDTGAAAERGSARAAEAARREGVAASRAAGETTRMGRAAERAAGAARRMAGSVGKAAQRLREAGAAGKMMRAGLDKLENRWVGLAGAVGVGAAVRQVGNLQERLVRFQNAAVISAEKMRAFKKAVFDVAQDPKIRISPDALFGAAEEYVAKTGDYEGALKNLRGMAKGIQAFGSSGQEIGAIGAAGRLNLGIDDTEKALSIILGQGKVGSVEAKDLAGYLPQTAASYASLGRKGEQGLTEVGALMQAVNTATTNVAVTSTAIQALSRDLMKNGDKLADLGVDLWDQDILLKEGRKVARPLHKVVIDMLESVGGDIEALLTSGIVTDESRKVFESLMSEGGRAALNAALEVKASSNVLGEDAARVAATFNASVTAFSTAWQNFADRKLTGPLDTAASALSALGSEGADSLFSTAMWAGGIATTLVGLRKAWRGIKTVRSWFPGGDKGAGGAMGAALRGGVADVRVVNWPGGGLGGAFDGSGLGGGRGGRASRAARRAGSGRWLGRLGQTGRTGRLLARGGSWLGSAGRGLGKVFRPLGMVLGMADLASGIASGSARGIGRSLGGLGGSAAGSLVGATLGSVVPVVGTAVGGILGGMLGGWLGEKGGEAAASVAEGKPVAAAAATQKQVTINVYQQPGEDGAALAHRVAGLVADDGTEALHDG
ncbi:MAG: phage tail tape measure protein [Desulfovibrionaceae bacterium]